MAGRIPQSFINELLSRVDLVEVISHRINLKKTGRNYSACCPFHNEKTPSFSVNPDKQFYYCFGCGASGNALTFLMEYEGQEFVVAIEDLAAQIGLEVPREAYSGEQQHQHRDLFPLMEKVSQFYQQQLKNHPQAKKAIHYLKNRGLSGKIAKQYGIGFAPAEWQNLSHLANDTKQLQKDLVETGMMIEKENGHAYDRFRDRIMFPIRNRRGQILGFGGRVIDQGEPKYLNSPETSLFHKSRELYGLFEMRHQLRNVDHIIIVEGYMDVVALAQYNIYNATATLGTATTSEHLQALFRICSKVIFCFDGDKAGKAAALRALKHSLPLMKDTREIRLMFLPDGEDPDSLVRKIGTDAFKQQVDAATTLFDYLIDYLKSQVDMETFEGPARLVHLAKPYFQAILDPVLNTRFAVRLCELSGLNNDQLQQVMLEQPAKTENQEIPKPIKNQHSIQSKENTFSQKNVPFQPKTNSPFRRAIALLLQYPEALPATEISWLKEINELGAKLLYDLSALLHEHKSMTTAMLIENWRDQPEAPHLTKLATLELHSHSETVSIELREIFKRLEKTYFIEQKCEFLIEKSRKHQLTELEKKTLSQLLALKSQK